MPRGRKKIEINLPTFIRILEDIKSEPRDSWPTMESIKQEVAARYNSERDQAVSASFVYTKIREVGFDFGREFKRGRSDMSRENVGPRKKTNLKVLPEYKEWREKMNKVVPSRFKNLLNKMEKGSKAAAIKMNCLDCCNYDTTEVKECNSTSCPSYLIRPYQKKIAP